MRISCITLFAILIASAANAQSVRVNQPYTVCASHDGLDTLGYQLYVNDIPVASTAAQSLVNGEVCFPQLAPNQRGPLVLIISSYNADGESKSEPLNASVVNGPPNKPGKPRITTGAVSFNKDDSNQLRLLE